MPAFGQLFQNPVIIDQDEFLFYLCDRKHGQYRGSEEIKIPCWAGHQGIAAIILAVIFIFFFLLLRAFIAFCF